METFIVVLILIVFSPYILYGLFFVGIIIYIGILWLFVLVISFIEILQSNRTNKKSK